VHDIGKNIVTVVLQCNNFEVVNMGVMVPCSEILARAKVEGADIVGLSGLITPSLEEMAHVAAEMERDEWFRVRKIPLLIGGATTSRVHTAVKIAPHYSGPVIHVTDASRSVPVAQNLVSDDARVPYLEQLRTTTSGCARSTPARRAGAGAAAEARARQCHAPRLDRVRAAKPKFVGRRLFRTTTWPRSPLHRLGPFFQTWDLHGPYPAILNDEVVGESARRVFSDGQAMLEVIDGRWLTANAVVAFLPGQQRRDDDIEVYTDDVAREVADSPGTTCASRQEAKREGVDNKCLADFIAPKFVDGKPSGHRRLHRPVRGHQRPRHREARKPSSPRCTTTTRRSCSRRSPTAWPRRSPSAARARAQGPVGLRRRRGARQRGR
jgi:5-methyltetrahydrofolate--homocysteine methyltransferase